MVLGMLLPTRMGALPRRRRVKPFNAAIWVEHSSIVSYHNTSRCLHQVEGFCLVDYELKLRKGKESLRLCPGNYSLYCGDINLCITSLCFGVYADYKPNIAQISLFASLL